METNTTTITTRSRKLEQFFYAHGVCFLSCDKDEDGMTVWTYENTEENRRISEEFRRGIARLAEKKGA